MFYKDLCIYCFYPVHHFTCLTDDRLKKQNKTKNLRFCSALCVLMQEVNDVDLW